MINYHLLLLSWRRQVLPILKHEASFRDTCLRDGTATAGGDSQDELGRTALVLLSLTEFVHTAEASAPRRASLASGSGGNAEEGVLTKEEFISWCFAQLPDPGTRAALTRLLETVVLWDEVGWSQRT